MLVTTTAQTLLNYIFFAIMTNLFKKQLCSFKKNPFVCRVPWHSGRKTLDYCVHILYIQPLLVSPSTGEYIVVHPYWCRMFRVWSVSKTVFLSPALWFYISFSCKAVKQKPSVGFLLQTVSSNSGHPRSTHLNISVFGFIPEKHFDENVLESVWILPILQNKN